MPPLSSQRAGQEPGRTRHGALMVRSVERSAGILCALYRSPYGKCAADLSRELGLPSRTVRRLLRTLASVGAADKYPDSDLYHRNPATWLILACDLAGFESTDDTLQGILNDLERETGLRVNLGAPDPKRHVMIKVAWYLPRIAMGAQSRYGKAMPAHATAVGLAYLAGLPPESFGEWTRGRLVRVTECTITSKARLKQEIARVREQGYAVCRQTHGEHSAAVAVPVRDAGGRTALAISVGGPAELLTQPAIRRSLPHLRKAASRLCALLHAAPLGVGEPGTEEPAGRHPARQGAGGGGGDRMVRSVERAVSIVDVLSRAGEPRRLADLTGELGIHKATALRLLNTLVAAGVVHRDDGTGRYVCDPLMWLGGSCGPADAPSRSDGVRRIMEGIAHASTALVWLAAPDPGGRAISIAATAMPAGPAPRRERDPPMQEEKGARASAALAGLAPSERRELLQHLLKPTTGPRFDMRERLVGPMHTTASGKVFLADLAPSALRRWMQREWPGITAKGAASRERLMDELAEARKQGYAVSQGEALPGVFSMGVPVRGISGKTIACLGVAALASRIPSARIPRLAHILKTGAKRITVLLGPG